VIGRPPPYRPTDLLARYFALGLVYLAAAALVALARPLIGWPDDSWLALHLAFVGGVSQLVLGAGQFFAAAFLATTPPPARVVAAQALAWNTGTLLVLVGTTTGRQTVTVVGAAALVVGLAVFLAALRGLRRRSLQNAPWALRWYQACAVFLTTGIVAGTLLTAGISWPGGSLLGTHMTLNLAGWFGTAIVGTLHTFFPSLTNTRLPIPALQPVTFGLWTGGTAVLAVGFGSGAAALTALGWVFLAAASICLGANMVACIRAAPALALPARLVATGQACLMPALVVAACDTVARGVAGPPADGVRTVMATLLLPGWIGLTVTGSLLHLLPLIGRVRDFRRPLPSPRPTRDRLLTAAVTLAIGAAIVARIGLPQLVPAALICVAVVYAALAALVAGAAQSLLPRGR
jgi:nitrite reductase (NO-forming)